MFVVQESIRNSIHQLKHAQTISDKELRVLLEQSNAATDDMLFSEADQVRRERYGTAVYLRGLIEFTNYCKNNCYYCGIRQRNTRAVRYRFEREEILSCCEEGYTLGFHTFVLQGGEDPFYTDKEICEIVSAIRERFPDCAITLSIGEKPRESYAAYFVREQTAIFCGTKLRMRRITVNCIRRRCTCPIGNAVCSI